MPRIRSEFQFDRASHSSPTSAQTAENRFSMNCGMCGGRVFVDESLKERLESAREQGLDENPLVCADCETEIATEEGAVS